MHLATEIATSIINRLNNLKDHCGRNEKFPTLHINEPIPNYEDKIEAPDEYLGVLKLPSGKFDTIRNIPQVIASGVAKHTQDLLDQYPEVSISVVSVTVDRQLHSDSIEEVVKILVKLQIEGAG